ncbi:MAG: 4Fe-4S binding protein [Spirochaetota bacterium]
MTLKITQIINKFLLPVVLIIIFSMLGLGVYAYKQKPQYFFLFFGMGFMVALGEIIIIIFSQHKQILRRIIQGLVGGGLFFGISINFRVNFQFSEVIFDIMALVVTGALIQFIIARLIMPFVVGNAFCSRVCWDGAVFELSQSLLPKAGTKKHRSVYTASGYLLFIIILAVAVAHYRNPALDENQRIWWIIGENIFLLAAGFGLSYIWGRRAYCRMLCPFITISGVFSKYSIFKIAPANADKCIECGKCNNACPMMIDVSSFVKNRKRINNRSCILCEQCVSSCVNECLKLAPGLPWK